MWITPILASNWSLRYVTTCRATRKTYGIDVIGRVSLARENEAGAVGDRKSIFSMLTYRTLFCFCL